MSLSFDSLIDRWLDRWLESRTLPGLLRQRLEQEPASEGSLSDMLAVAIARQEMEWALEVWAEADRYPSGA